MKRRTMRVNIEEEELGSSRLRKMAHLLGRHPAFNDVRRMAIGYLVDLWHQAINNGKRELTQGEIMDYLGIYDDEAGQQIVSILEECRYLVKTDTGYEVAGKEKDFIARDLYVAKGRKGGYQKAKNLAGAKPGLSRGQTRAKHGLSTGLAPAKPGPSRGVANAVQSTADQINTNVIPIDHDQIIENHTSIPSEKMGANFGGDFCTQIIHAPAGAVAIAPDVTKSRIFRGKWFEMYAEVMNGATPPWGKTENSVVKHLLTTYSLNDLLAMINVYFRFKPSNAVKDGYPLVGSSSSFKHLSAQLYADIKNPARRVFERNTEKRLNDEMRILERVSLATTKDE